MPTGGRIVWNDAELDELLNGINGPTARKLQSYAEIVTQGAKRRAATSPDGSHGRPSGYMRSSIGWRIEKDSRGLVAIVEATATTPDGDPYPLFVELGTAPHIIESHGDYPLRDKYGNVYGKRVQHPGTSPQPFLRPALDDIRRME
jgi:hypothetical protein